MAKKDDLPAMMFYVGDWLKAPDIQSLDYETKGIWFEMLCIMWESNERGYLTYSRDRLARLLRLPEVLLEQKVEQLLNFGICSIRESDGAIYCRRMVKDQEIREIRKKAGSLGGKQSFANRFAQAKSQAKNEQTYEDEYETEYEDVNDNELGKRNVKGKTIIPLLEDFLEYCKTLKPYSPSLDFSLEAKYNAWVENDWKDGNNNKIKNWKTKIQNTITYLKGNNNGTKNSPRGTIDFNKWGKLLKESQPSPTEMASGSIIKELEQH